MARRRVRIDTSSCSSPQPLDTATSTTTTTGIGKQQQQQQQQIEEVEVSFHHAAPFFTARTKEFRDGLLAQWEASGLASRWPLSSEGDDDDDPVWVGVPSNHAIARGIANGVQATVGGDCLFGQHVQAAEFDNEEKT